MTKAKYLIGLFLISALLFIIPNVSNAAVNVTRNVYSNNGSMKFNFTGLTLDTTHEYEYGLTKTSAEHVETWHLITEYTVSTATVDVVSTTKDLREVINSVDTGYITIRDKTTNNTVNIVLQPYAVDLKLPYLNVTNYSVITNGKSLDNSDSHINVPLRNASNSIAYYKYEKITDQNIINKYKEIKSKNGDVTKLQDILKTNVPSSDWSTWGFWNGYDSSGMEGGYGYTQRTIQTPDTGLYYMWVYFSGKNIKNIYGYILVDNLEPDVALESVSLPKTATVELGKTLTLSPTFNPSTATNKIVTWSSSDETVATVDNAGKITPKKLGSTIITVTSKDGNKKATCTVTVTQASNNNTQNPSTPNNNPTLDIKDNGGSGSSGTSTGSGSSTKDTTVASGKIPQTGATMTFALVVIALIGSAVLGFAKYNKLKDV